MQMRSSLNMQMRSSLKIFLIIFILLIIFSLLLSFVTRIAILVVAISIAGLIATIRDIVKLNNIRQLPVLTLYAKVISKHTKIQRHTTFYYSAFELTNGVRKMFQVPLEVYGVILENENGILSYKEQGKILEFIGFQKTI